MKIYEVDTGGAYYWVVAENLIQAFEIVRACWESEGSLEDMATGDSIHFDEVSEERARRIKIDDDEAGSQPLWDVARAATRPEVVACSEWP